MKEKLNYLKHSWFDEEVINEGKDKYIKGRRTRMTPRNNRLYNEYKTSRYSFVYQYFDLDEETKNYDVLYKMIIKYMTKAKEILANKDYLMKNL